MPRASTNLASTVRLFEMQEAQGKMQRKDAEHKRHERGAEILAGQYFFLPFCRKRKIGQIFLFGIRSRSRRLKTIIKAFIIKAGYRIFVC